VDFLDRLAESEIKRLITKDDSEKEKAKGIKEKAKGINLSEFEKRTIVILAAMHYKAAGAEDSHEYITMAEESLIAVLSGYNIALDADDPLYTELHSMIYGVQL
jgi:hypothetical protein